MESKPWYASKTVWGLVVTALGVIAAHWHYQVPADDQTVNTVIEIATKAAEVLGLLTALWGRVKATAPLAASTRQ